MAQVPMAFAESLPHRPDLPRHEKRRPTCPICHGTYVCVFRAVQDPVTRQLFEIVRCPQCGLAQTLPQPQDLSSYYGDYHGGRHAFTARHCANRRISWVKKFVGIVEGKRLLDIGCGEGTFLLTCLSDGWKVMGTELNPDLPRSNGLRVVSDLSEIGAEHSFECICLWHSLEHLRDPLGTMRRVRELVSADGVLLIAVPDVGGIQANLFAENWLHLDVPRHLFHFNLKSLSALLSAAEFKPFRWWHQEFEYDLMGWSQSALNKFMPTSNVFFDFVRGRSTDVSAMEKALNWVGGIGFSVIAAPMVPLTSLIGRGGTLVVAARPVPIV